MYYFISDIHLGLESREKETLKQDLLLEFLDKISDDCEKLFIVGDLFDYWFEYKTVIPSEFFRILTKFYDIKKKGFEIVYIMGNHDFGHHDFFESELGIPIVRSDIETVINNKKFYISHGDGKAHNDQLYLMLKSVLRNPVSNLLYRVIHPDIGISIARNSSRSSRKYTSEKNYGESEGMTDFARKKIDEGFDYIIMGHRHKAENTKYNSGYYINLGDWLNPEPTFAIFDGEKVELKAVRKFLNS